jgi:trk system potassium uptake protein TrkH
VIALKVAGMTLYDALNHTFATMATGGFSTKMLSIGEFHSALIDGIITFFMLAAGANFSLYYFILKGEIKEVLRDSEFRTYLGLVVVAITFVTFNIYGHNYEHLGQAFRYAAFQVSSIITTTGFVTADFDTWPTFSKGILVALMFVGGCAGSTSGSIKVMRFLVLFKQGIRELKRLIHPRAIVALKVGDKAVDYPVLINVLQFFFIYIFIFLVSVIVMSGFGLDLISAFTSVAATLGNVGPGLGIVGPMYSYDAIPYLGKLVLAFLMLLGRLELYTVLVLFLPDFWRN